MFSILYIISVDTIHVVGISINFSESHHVKAHLNLKFLIFLLKV